MASPAPAFAGYRVLGMLGQGGMGQVYLAEDEMLGRRVAIKTIKPEVSGQGEHKTRFLREARAMATVEHPHVVRVYAFGEAAGQAYFVMELVEGETLQARLQRTPRLEIEEALRLAREVAEALQAAWQRGIVHRDVKPSNIILDRESHAHVADFGLARPAERQGDTSVTRDGAFVGSPHYVAPEQARAQTTDFRTDIYSLGIVLYEMIAGRRPFDGRTPAEVVARQLTEPTPPLRSVAPDTPDPVARLVETMTEKDPTLRPASYPTLIAGLSGTAPVATLPTSSMPEGLRAGARRARVRLGAALLLLPILGAGYALRDRWSRAPRPAGELVIGLAPFSGADEESQKEGRTFATLVASETTRLLADEEGRAVGLSLAKEPASNARGARGLGARSGADVVLWGEALAFRGDVEIQPTLTGVADAASAPPRLSPILLESQSGAPIEIRRRAASGLAEAVLRFAAQRALDAGQAEKALRLLRECSAGLETLELRAAALEKLGRAGEAAAARGQAASFKN
jgi:predicted Ser/Thr protein kinase